MWLVLVAWLWLQQPAVGVFVKLNGQPIPDVQLDNGPRDLDIGWGDPYDQRFQEFAVRKDETGLFPNIFNLATNARIKVNATCGDPPESYCKLVEHVYLRRPQCDRCNASQEAKRHPIEKAIDGSQDWWQSPTLAMGLRYEWVTITIDLRQVYQVAYVIVKSAIAPRPGRWILERSLDDVTYMPWQYFASTDAECQRVFGIPASRAHRRHTRDDEVICTSHFSKLNPLEDGEAHVSLVNGRPGVVSRSETLQNFTRARYVRLRLQKIRTLNADLMVISRHSRHQSSSGHDVLDESVTRRYFYAIKDISIGGQCICYGHAETCPTNPITGQLQCDCKHNTCGSSCGECCPLFNQKPWAPGTIATPNYCEQCQCFNHAERCEYDAQVEADRASITPDGHFEGGGKCVDCMHNTAGINCQECKPGFYRPQGVSHYRADACQPCDCNLDGSLHPNCVKDETQPELADGMLPGDCHCKTGFGGRQCDRCALGFRNYPTCEPCPCNRHGSANFATCDDECQCKANVEGTYCDRCKDGFINLDVENPAGCQPCFCFGVAGATCHEFNWGRAKIRELANWTLTEPDGRKSVPPVEQIPGQLSLDSYEQSDTGLIYWKAPAQYTGNLLPSYTGLLQYFVYFVASQPGYQAPFPDVVIEGNDMKLEYHSRREFMERENVSVQVKLTEAGNHWFNAATRAPVTKREFMRALANVSHLLIRAKYVSEQVQSSIFAVSLDKAVDYPEPEDTMRGVEQCKCPENFMGLSCEQCIPGYRRVNAQLYGGECVKCDCNDHSLTCDPYSGHCDALTRCEHNTTGARCEQCLPGHYGNPSLKVGCPFHTPPRSYRWFHLQGAEGACKQCACPLTNVENNFSPSCMLAEYSTMSEGDADYMCTACPIGYVGSHCERCDDGFFGDPTAVNGSCRACDCNGNVDPAAVGYCSTETGVCTRCIYNTEGDHCERCLPNHYGNATEHSCTPCECHHLGAADQQCDRFGMCNCTENYRGQQCDMCLDGHGDVDAGCPPCACNMTGAVDDVCHPSSGQCSCKVGVFGKHCNQCKTNYYAFSETGCAFCECDEYGSVDDGTCDAVSGNCTCRQHVTGQKCNDCETGFFNITSRQGCEACACNELGAVDNTCDIISGKCKCKYGVTGLKCDKCEPNHFGLSADGCKVCPSCPAVGQVCDPVTGDCMCPPNTIGKTCENCTEHTWNYDPYKGCQTCDCELDGSLSADCDLYSGECKCKPGYNGQHCDQCRHGHYEYPTCKQCKCSLAGTKTDACVGDKCACAETGVCPCKSNVEGKKCQKCEPTSFTLEQHNPNGCTKCFCFNRTSFCVQSNYIWQPLFSDDRTVFFENTLNAVRYDTERGIQVLKRHPDSYSSIPPSAGAPLYWPLKHKYQGDRITSYNGFLRFRIQNWQQQSGLGPATISGHAWNAQPLVILVGNDRINLQYFDQEQPNESGRYKVRLREDLWLSRTSPEVPVTRKQMMIALQNVQDIYIRATFVDYVTQTELTDVSLDVGVMDNATETADRTALGVEQCADCPHAYTGSSCQDPAEGYCRKRVSNFLDQPDDIALIGDSVACACFGHSTVCHPETCICLDCQHNTTGDFCELCAPGYYGDAEEQKADSCQQCACPRLDAEGSFSPTCLKTEYGKGYYCNACAPGYEGQYCETCMEKYYGDPTAPGGQCYKCDCHEHGSLSERCDPNTGQCPCRPGLTGRDCSRCQPRHALVGNNCRSCDQGCTLELMLAVDELEGIYDSYNYTGLVPVPWSRLRQASNNTVKLNARLERVLESETAALELIDTLGSPKAIVDNAKVVTDSAQFVLDRVNGSSGGMYAILQQTRDVQQQLQDTYRMAYEQVNELVMYARGHGHGNEAHSIDTTSLLNQGNEYLKGIKERDEYLKQRSNYAKVEKNNAAALLDELNDRKWNDTVSESLYARLDTVDYAVNEAHLRLWDDSRPARLAAENMTRISRKRMQEFKRVSTEISRLDGHSEDNLSNATNAIAQSKDDILATFDDFESIREELAPVAENATAECHALANQYSDLLREYQGELVLPANAHADQLAYQASMIKDSFSHTKAVSTQAVTAAGAYDSIVQALNMAMEAANDAWQAANNTYSQINEPTKPVSADGDDDAAASAEATGDSADTLLTAAAASNNASLSLLTESASLDVQTLEARRVKAEKRLGDVNEQVIDGQQELDKLTGNYDHMDVRHSQMEAALAAAETAKSDAELSLQNINTLQENIEQLEQETELFEHFTGSGVRQLTDEITAATAEIGNAQQKMSDVMAQAERNEQNVALLGDNLALLKEKIREAREKASKIPIAVRSDHSGACVRSFVSPAHPTPANLITVTYRPLDDVADSLLFITKTKRRRTQPSEYLALELRDRNFVFHWNIGAGDRMITNDKRVDSIAANNARNWYKVTIKREGNGASLTVALMRQTDDETGEEPVWPPVTVQHQFAGDERVFNTEPGITHVTLGTKQDQLPSTMQVSEFRGSIGRFEIDGNRVPLWNFAKNTQQCTGAISAMAAPRVGYMFQNGYAQVEAARQTYHEQRFSISVYFAAYSPNGLVYFRGDPEQQDFVAIYLSDGHVVLEFYLGGVSELRLTSKQPYNDGATHNIIAIRDKQKGTLQVGTDDLSEGEAEGDAVGLNVRDQPHYVAGVPMSFNRTMWEDRAIEWDGFYGCIHDIRPDAQSRSLDIGTASKSYGVSHGCMRNEKKRLQTANREVSFDAASAGESAYMVVPGVILGDENAALSFSFRTSQANAALLYQSSRVTTYRRRAREVQGQGFISFYLYGGILVAHVGTSAKESGRMVTLRSGHMCNNSRIHTVFLSRHEDKVVLMVNDRVEQQAVFDDRNVIGSARAQLFLGGFPEGTEPVKDEMPEHSSLHGCILDLFVDYSRVPMVPEQMSNTFMGVCKLHALAESTSTAHEDTEAHPAHLGSDRLELNLLKPTIEFEETSTSQVTESLLTTRSILDSTQSPSVDGCAALSALPAATVGVRFGLTDTAHSRVIFSKPYPDVANFTVSFSLRTNQSDGILLTWANYRKFTQYFNLTLVDGRVWLVAKGHRRAQVLRFLPTTPALNDGKWHQVTMSKLGRTVTLRADEHEITHPKMPKKIGVLRKRLLVGGMYTGLRRLRNETMSNFDGCMRDLTVDGVARDLLAAHRDVIPCAHAASTYVAPEGYITFEQAESEAATVLQYGTAFRTAQASGYLLLVSGTKDYHHRHIAANVIESQLFVTVVEESKRVAHFVVPGSVCDGRWHTLDITLDTAAAQLNVKLDSNLVFKQLPRADWSRMRKLPVHVAGISKSVLRSIGGESLSGCFDRVSINGQPIEMTNARRLHKALPHGCPYD